MISTNAEDPFMDVVEEEPSLQMEGCDPPRPSCQPCYFLESTPTELRFIVYRYLLPTDMTIEFENKGWEVHYAHVKLRTTKREHKVPTTPQRHNITHANILCTNKQICNEAVSVLYGENRFRFDMGADNGYFRNTMDSLGQTAISHLTHVELRYRCRGSEMERKYKRSREWFHKFALCLEDGHCLKELKILCQLRGVVPLPRTYNQRIGMPYVLLEEVVTTYPLPTVLEPLASLFGIENVVVQGVEKEFACKLEKVMMGKKKTDMALAKDRFLVAGSRYRAEYDWSAVTVSEKEKPRNGEAVVLESGRRRK
jgi:hypothetical protein